MENENVSLSELFELFEKRKKFFEKFLEIANNFLLEISENIDKNFDKWQFYIDERQKLIIEINKIEEEIFKLLDCQDKNVTKILSVLRSKKLIDIANVEIKTRDTIEKIIDIDKKILKLININLSESLSDFAEFENNKYNIQKTYLKMPEVSSRFIDKRDE